MALLAWYKLDEDVKDSSGNALDGTNSGVTFVSGKVDNAGQFISSQSDKIAIMENYSGTFTAITIVCWVKADTKTGDMGIIYLRDSTNADRFNIYFQNSTGKIHVYIKNDSGNADLNSTVDLSTTAYQLIVATYDGTTTKLYIDNVEKASSAVVSGNLVFTGTQDNWIGSQGSSSLFFDGLEDNVKIFDHVLSANERFAEFNRDQYIINGFPYAKEFRDGDITQTALFRLRTGEIILSDDSNNTIVNRLENGQDVHIYNNYSLVFRGLIENFVFDEDKTITIDIIDYSFYLAEDFVTYTATAKLASTIVTELIDTYGNNLFGKNITATTFVYSSKIWRAYSPIEIIQELALDEGYTFFVDENRQFNFVPQNFNDTGITLVDGTTIFNRSFPHDNTKLKNKIIVIGKGATDTAGIRVVARDPVSIAKYGQRAKRIEDTAIETEDQAIERANSELTRLANPLIIGELSTARNFLLTGGSIMRVTLSQKGWTAKEFLILEAEHELETPITHLTLAEINPLNSDQLGEILFKQRLTAKNWEDDAVPVTQYERWSEEIEVEMLLYVEKQNPPTRDWNEFEWNSSVDWDLTPGSWSVIINGEIMGLTTLGLNRLRDLIVGKAVTDFAAANANIAIGSGTTPFNIADTVLETEDYRKTMDSGFPRNGSLTGENEHQSSWSDVDFASGSFNEMGILDNTVGGLLLARAVPTSSFSKAVNENLRVRSKLRFFQ